MNKTSKVLPLVYTFLILTCLTVADWLFNKTSPVDHVVVLCANVLFFFMSILVFGMQVKAMQHKNPAVFIRTVMASMSLKMIVCLIAVIGYVLGSGKGFNKAAVYVSLGCYLVYLLV